MDTAKVLVETLKRRARDGDREALQALRERGFFQSHAASQGFPASRTQQRVWVSVHKGRTADAYVINLSLRLLGPLRRAEFERALETLYARHETLRTRFAEREGELRQFVEAPGPLPLTFRDFSAEDDPEEACRACLRHEALAPFDLRQAPLWRVHLCRLGDEDHVWLLLIHHIIADAWSLEVLQKELALLYRAYCEGRPDPLPPLAQQYRDYAAGQFGHETTKLLADSRDYWREQLAAPPAPAQLPTDFARASADTFAGASLQVLWDEARVGALHELASRHDASLFIALEALVKVLLYRYSGQTDLLVGTPIAGRDRPELEGQVGLFINLLVLRDRLDPEGGFDRLLAQASRTALEAYAHREYPFDSVVEELAKTQDTAAAPLFNVLVGLQNVATADVALDEIRVVGFALDAPPPKYDLTFEFSPQGGGLVLLLTYSTALFETATIERLCGHLARLLEAVLAEPGRPVRELPLLTRAEQQQFALWNRTATPYPRDETIDALFSRQAAATPHAVALSFTGGQLSYLELESRADRLAQYVSARVGDRLGSGPHPLVGICLPRSPEFIVAMLAVLKLGAAYLPLDPEYPTERLSWMLEDAHVSLLITEESLSRRLPEGAVQTVCVDSEAEAIARCPALAPPVGDAGAERLAYVMYTSGSTGRPKGVCVPHRAVVRLVTETNYIRLLPHHRVAHAANVCFDASTFEVWGPLLNGASAHLLTRDEVLDPDSFARRLKARDFDILFLTTALFNRLAQTDAGMFEPLEYLLFGGELVDARWVAAVAEGSHAPRHLLHVYGPTESTTFATWHEVKEAPEGERTVPIGLPLSNTEIHLLDEQQQLVPVGVAGELYVGGDGLALGYLERPELTRERFVEVPGLGRLYRTGDVCRRRADGAVEFIGRLDGQVKIRGFRIEPGEVEAALRREAGVKEAVVAVHGEGEHRQLVAYLLEDDEGALHAPTLRRRLRARLPEYMVPAQFVVLEEFPLNANGKVDRPRLPPPGATTAREEEPRAPLSLTEELLAGLWCEVLQRESVGRDDNFFELGGHSLLAMRVGSRIRDSLAVELPLFVIFEQPVLCDLAAQVDALRRADLPPRLLPLAAGDELPLSFAQQRLWSLSQLQAEAGATYTINAALRLDGRLDEAALRAALLGLTARQQSLRMNFRNAGGRPVISLRAPYDPLTVQDLRALPVAEREAAARDISNEYVRRPFDLERDALMRLALLVFGEEERVLLFSVHHIIADGWSLDVLVRDLGRLYAAALAHEEPSLPPLAVEYADYAAWQREWLQGEALERQLSYWRERLEGAPRLLNLPTDYPRPAARSYRGAQLTRRLEPELVSGLKRLSRGLDATLFMTLIAGFETLLHRYGGDEDIVVGTPIANRGQSETEHLIGFFTNTLAFRTDLSGDPTFAELVARVRQVALGAYVHQDVPFEKLISELKLDRALDHSPLFQVMFGLQNAAAHDALLPGVALRPLDLDAGTAKYDLLLMLAEGGGALEAVWEYSTDLFEEATVARMAEHFRTLLRAAVDDADCRLSALPLLDAGERELLLDGWNQTTTPYPSDKCVQRLFEEAAARAPEQVALVHEGERVTYSELNRRANRLARHLRRLSVGPEMLTGVCMERGVELIVSMLGILKAGAAYLPLDPAYPRERLRFMLSDASVRVLLTQKRLAGNLPEHDARVVCVDEQSDEIARESEENFDAGIGPDALAYVMYTSGSTGRPKGVCVPHRAVVRLVSQTNYVELLPHHRVAHAANVCFDASTFEVWGPLLNGASAHLLTRDEVLDPDSFARRLKARDFDILFLTTALFNRLAQTDAGMFEPLEYLLFGGELVDARWVAAVAEGGHAPRHLLHVYGPTESTTFATWHEVRAEELSRATVPIGKPISNTQLYVLDRRLQPVPVGVAGELYVGGDGLARGYWMRPALTAEKFIPDPYGPRAGARLYRTGDVCRRRPDGALEFLGRVDNQVKLRGFRVEPGEIEAALHGEPGVKEAVVVVCGEEQHRRLVAYLLADGAEPDVRAIQQGLRGKLPEYMVPAQFVVLDDLPLNANGKVDRSRLPAPEIQGVTESFVAPQTELERRLAAIWSAALGVERVGRHDNFFELGGDSILSIQIVAMAREQGLQFKTGDLFVHQTLADLSPYVSEVEAEASEMAEAGRAVPLTPIQKWFLARESEEPWHFNQAVLLRPRHELSADLLRAALKALSSQHAALRLRFTRNASGWEQTYAEDDADALPLHCEDLSGLPADEQSAALQERATFWQRSLNLSEGPLARVVLFEVSGGQRLFWCVHHLAVDAVSWRILLGDLQTALEALRRGREPGLPPPSAPFGAWADYLDDYARSERLTSDTAYWNDLPEPPALPMDFPDGEPTRESTAQVSVSLDKSDTRALLEEAHGAYNLRINDLLLTALAQTLSRWTGRADCVLELEGHGRVEREGAPNLSRTVGWFTTLYPVRLVLPPTEEPGACLMAVKEQLRAVPAEGLGYGVLRYMNEPAARSWPEASLAFNYLGQFDQVTRRGLFDFASEGVGESHSRLGRRPRPLDVDALVSDGELRVSWGYSTNQYRPETVSRLAESFNAALRALVAHCRLSSSAGYTPSDFPLTALTREQLDALAARHGRNVAGVYPLSPMQQGLVFHGLYEGEGGGTAYFEQLHCRVEGALDEARFRAAWEALLRRHPILSTAFLLDTHPPLQVVYRDVALPWHALDWRHMDEAQQARALDTLLEDERRRGFDFSTAPLLRCHLVRLGEESYQFVWCFHHLLLDGWSLPVLFRELFTLLDNPDAELPALRPYQDYIAWLQRQDADAAAAHWRNYFAGFDAPTPLPGARPAAAGQSAGVYREFTFELDEEVGRRLTRFRSARRLTDNTLLQAAWALLLQRHSGERDVVFGVTVSGRDIPLHGVEGMLGLFINTLPLRLKSNDGPLWQWLQEAQTQHRENMRHGYLSLNQIQACSAVPGGTPLFDTIFVFENYPMETSLPQSRQSGLRFVEVEAVDHTNYPLTFVASAGEAFRFRISYDSQRFEPGVVERLAGHLRTLLAAMADSGPDTRLRDLPLLDAAERRQLLDASRARSAAAAVTQTLPEIFAAQAARDPDRIAVVCDGASLTYGELSARAKRLARLLRKRGARPDRLVGLFATRSVELVVGLLGILESGAAYLPLDAHTPPARLSFMLADADVVAVVTQTGLAAQLPESDAPRLYLDAPDEDEDEGAADGPVIATEPRHLAYVIYTSGSTGQPKGVMVTHENVTRLFDVTRPEYQFSDEDVWTLFHSSAFDFSVWEIWGALLFGGRLVVVPHAVSRDPVAFYELLESERVTVLNQTPSAFGQLIAVAEQMRRPLALRLVIFGGEALDLPALRPWFDIYGDRRPELVNMYGITETTVHVTWCPLRAEDTGCMSSLVGRQLDDLDLYLLDEHGQLVPVGVAGEIYVGGAGLARGYLNRPELTAERFPPDPFATRPGARLYRTGDLARRRTDGGLEYLGRIDHQVKLRGFRIELGEIEATLSQHPGVREAVVVARGAAPQQYLAAYVVVAAGVADETADLREWMAARLPEYMVPARFVVLDGLPLTVNGKVDRKALPEPGDAEPDDGVTYVAPRNDVERRLQEIWQEGLGRTDVGVEHNFFELGGHSLTAMQIVSAVYKTLGVRIPLRGLFEHPTIASLAALVADGMGASYTPIEPAPPAPDYPLSHSQLRLWLDNKLAGTATFNMPEAMLFEEQLDIAALKQALSALVARHETLRTSFVEVEGRPRQRIHPPFDFSVAEIDLGDEPAHEERTREIINREANAPFDVEMLPLFRATLIRQPGTRCVLVIVIHHIIGDGWSKNVLYHELSILYSAFRRGAPNPLKPLRIHYKDYAVWENALGFEQAERYWLEELAGAPTHISLPYDFPPPAERLFHGDRRTLILDAATSQALRELAAARETTLSTLMFALFQLFLFQISRQDDLCVGTVVANRHHPDLENLIGCFVNILPVRTRLSRDMDFDQLLDRVIQSSYGVLEHQNYPFDLLLHRFSRVSRADLRPFLDVGYLFQNSFDTRLKLGTQMPQDVPRQEGSVEFSFEFTKFDLSLTVMDLGPEGVKMMMEYDSALFMEGTILGYLNTLGRFAKMIAAQSQSRTQA